MFRKLTLLLSLVLAMGFAVSTTAAAQDVPASADDIEGLESGYARMYMPDFAAMIESVGTPGAEMTIDENGVMLIMISGFTFDSEDNASKAVDLFSEGMTGETSGLEGMESSEIDDLGDKNLLINGETDEAGEPMATNMLLVQDGTSMYMISVTGGELDAGTQQVQDIAQHMIDGEIETEEVTFSEDGTSTGGVFDLMPNIEEDAELLSNLAPSTDMDMMGAGGL